MNDDTGASRDKLWKLIKDIKFAMFTTRHGNGHLHARPMTTQNKALDADESLWFFMSKSGDPVADIEGRSDRQRGLRQPVVGHLRLGLGHGGDDRGRGQEGAALEQARRGLVPRRPERPRPRPGAGADRPRQLLGREGKQARPALRDGQGRGHRQAADASSASTAKCACAERAIGHARRAPQPISTASTALFEASIGRVAAMVSLSTAEQRPCDTPLRHCTSRTPSPDLPPPGGAIEWEELPSLAQRAAPERLAARAPAFPGTHPPGRARQRAGRRSRFASR